MFSWLSIVDFETQIFLLVSCFTIRFYTELSGPAQCLVLVEYNANNWTMGILGTNYRRLVQLHNMLPVNLLVLCVLTNTQVALIVVTD